MTSINASPPLSINRRLSFPILALLAVLALSLLFLMPGRPAQAQEAEGLIMYAEDREDAVRTFTSADPEEAGIDWDVTGTDADDFMIVRNEDGNGVLSFIELPNFEAPTDRAHAARDVNGDGDTDDPGEAAQVADSTDNFYQITVRATEQRAAGETGRALSTETHITVQVTNVDEPGTITLNRLHPEVGAQITATLTDPDGDTTVIGGDLGWQWSTSKSLEPDRSVESDWNDATGTGNDATAYTPAGKTAGTTGASVDEGRYLRVVVTYTDTESETGAKKVIVVSANPVRADVSNAANGSPGFHRSGDYTRTVPENTPVDDPVGDPVVASDPDLDTLTYALDNDATRDDTLLADHDVNFFSIDQATGQITVKKSLSHEAGQAGRTADGDPGAYEFVVRATDPNGDHDDVDVTINATDVNDAPRISMGSAERRAFEQDSDDADNDGTPDTPYTGLPELLNTVTMNSDPNVYIAADEDAFGDLTWSLEGTDAGAFDLNAQGLTRTGRNEIISLRFKSPPDYEAPTDANWDGVYKVTVVVTDDKGATGKRPVTVFVDPINEQGWATLQADGDNLADEGSHPLVNTKITATVTDPDEGVAIVTWQWSRTQDKTEQTPTWMVIPGETTDSYTPERVDRGYFLRATATYIDTTSVADDPDTTYDDRVQSADDTAKAPVDDDGSTPEDSTRLYRVIATSHNAVESVVPGGTPPSAVTIDIELVENAETGSIVGAPLDLVGESYELGTDGDNALFTIDEHGQIRVGQVTFPDPLPDTVLAVPDGASAPDNEDPVLDYEGHPEGFVLDVTVKNGETTVATARVFVRLTDVNEPPSFNKASREDAGATIAIAYVETRMDAVETFTAVDGDGADVRYDVWGTDAADFDISATGVVTFKNQPDFENPTDRPHDANADGDTDDSGGGDEAAADGMYHITVRATEKTTVGDGPPLSDTLDVTVQVTNGEDPGTVSLSLLQPEVGTELMATLEDVDTPQSPSWQWYRAKNTTPDLTPDLATIDDAGSDWEEIDAATSVTYTPVAVDEGWRLLVAASYTDGVGPETNMAPAVSANPVQADVSDGDNRSPDFRDAGNGITRSVPEDTEVGGNVGAPVAVPSEGNEDGDILTYELESASEPNAGDTEFFNIDPATGQLTVKKTLSHEATDDRDYDGIPGTDAVTAGEYVVVVMATDPSGETTENENIDTITVTITTTNVNEAPRVSSEAAMGQGLVELTVNEADSSKKPTDEGAYYIGLGNILNTDTTDDPNDVTVNDNLENLYKVTEEDDGDRTEWSFGGADKDLFKISVTTGVDISRRIHFVDPPDYENPMDDDGDNVYEVTVVVTDEGDDGTPGTRDDLTGSKDVRVEVLNMDEAGKLTLMAVDEDGEQTATPGQPIVGDTVMAVLEDPDGTVIVTDWEWATSTSSTVADFSGAVAVPGQTMVTYADGAAGQFLWARVSYRDGASVKNDPVTALDERNDDLGSVDSPTGTIDTDFDSDEMEEKRTANAVKAQAGAPSGPGPAPAPESRSVPENVPSTGYVGVPLEVTGTIGGADADSFEFAEDHDLNADTVTYYSGDDLAPDPDLENDKFGQLALQPVTNLDRETKDTYMITVGRTIVVVTVTGINDPPSAPEMFVPTPPMLVAGPSITTLREGETNIDAAYRAVRAGDAMVTWALSGDDAGAFSISNDGVVSIKAAPDFEDMATYQITVTATAGDQTASLEVTVTVTNVEEKGAVTLPPMAPRVGIELTARVTDRDEVVDGSVTWQWASSDAMAGIFAPIEGAKNAAYTPVEADDGMYLQATASYTDGEGSGKSATSDASEQVVIITSPMFDDGLATEISVAENTAAGAIGAPFTATDADGDTPDYSLASGTGASFSIDAATGQLSTTAELDYETAMSHMVAVEVRDNEDDTGAADTAVDDTIDVTVNVTNVDEDGTVTLDSAPQVGAAITARVTDPDGGVTDETWQWASSASMAGAYTDIEGAGAMEAAYTPTMDDEGMYLRATAAYDDGVGATDSAMMVTAEAVVSHSSPAFADDAATAIDVAEDTAAGGNIGGPYMATDADGDTPVYALSGADATAFTIDGTGQLMTSAALDYETAMTYMVTVEVRDNEDATGAADTAVDDTIDVTVNVTNVDEDGMVTLDSAPVVGAAITASVTDPDSDVTGETWQWARSATMDGTYIDIEGAMAAAYTPTMDDEGMYLRATATYDDGVGPTDGAMMATAEAVVFHSSPAFADDAATAIDVAEDTAAGGNIGGPYMATDADGDTPVYAVSGTDAASFTIDSGTGQLMTRAALDYETKMTYMVTVEVRDNEDATGAADTAVDDSIGVTVTVTNVDEDGTVTLPATAPVVGTPIMARVTDPDNVVDGSVTWQWASSDAMAGTYTDIEAATDASYTPVDGDVGNYLRATASYDDGVGSTDTGEAISANPVVAGGTLLGQYDTDNSGGIERRELITAIRDFLFNKTIDRSDLLGVIRLHLFPPSG